MRRVYLADLRPGLLTPDAEQGHHLRSVLRLAVGETVEAFDDAGHTADARVTAVDPAVTLCVDAVAPPPARVAITVAAAVPKGERAEWLVEKLSEFGVARFLPLRTARSVVHPDGPSKLERWRRIAVESAKQCRRPGVMAIGPLTDLRLLLPTLGPTTAVYFSTDVNAALFDTHAVGYEPQTLLIGPEGDWSPDEVAAFVARGLTPASLGRTILRVETAAMFAAGLASFFAASTQAR